MDRTTEAAEMSFLKSRAESLITKDIDLSWEEFPGEFSLISVAMYVTVDR